jgi:hypothetical protein
MQERDRGRGRKMIFSFLTETAGSTVVEQFDAESLEAAMRAWFEKSSVHPGHMPSDLSHPSWVEPTPLAGLLNAWCYSGEDPKGVFYLVHVFATTSNQVGR